MEQLKLQTYTRKEMSTLLNLDLKDKNFARKLKNTLNTWGYTFEKLPRKKYKITRVPTTVEEKLSEILIRRYNMNIQTDAFAFGVFIICLNEDIDGFAAMPWEERSNYLDDCYGICISDRTLRTWANRLFDIGLLVKNNEDKVEWITVSYQGEKERKTIEEAEEEYGKDYMDKYKQLRKQYIDEYLKQGMSFGKAYQKAVFEDLFCGRRASQYQGLILYKCSSICFSAFSDDTTHNELEEIFDLCVEIANEEPFETEIVEISGTRLERKNVILPPNR